MTKWIVLSLITLILWGIWGVALKVASRHLSNWKDLYIASNSAVTIVLIMILLTNLGNVNFSLRSFSWGFLAGLLGTLGYIFMVLSLEVGGKASIVIALTSIYPAITALLSTYFLKEKLTLIQWIGIFMAVLAIILLSLGGSE